MMKLDADLIEGFVRAFLLKRFDKPTPIPQFHRDLWNLFCKDERYIGAAAPRGHAKSTAITHSYTLASVLFRLRKFVIIVSDTETQAIQFLNDIKLELIDNADLQQLFDFDKFIKYTENDIVVQFKDGGRFRILAKGSEQSLRGMKWNGKRPDLIVCDDMENDELVMNKERREKFMRWIYGALIPALSPDGIMRVVGTVLHLDSFLEQIMPKPWDKNTVKEELKDWSKVPQGMWVSVRWRAHNDDFSEILWPTRFPKETLVKIRKDYIERGIPDVYSQEYLNYPLDPTRAYFKKSDLVEMSANDKSDILEKRKPVTFYIADDPAVSEHERADYTAIIVAAMDSEGKLYVVEGIRDRIDTREHIDLLFDLYQKYRPEFIAIEKEKITKAIGPFLREEMMKRGMFPLIVEIPHGNKDLELRARSWQGRMRIGSVKFDKAADWYPIYEAELTTFPRGTKDDFVSASAIMGMALDRMVEAPTKEEIDEAEWEEQYQIMVNSEGLNGRSAVTGY
jgi:predicted phage terminase large subunit-like protein